MCRVGGRNNEMKIVILVLNIVLRLYTILKTGTPLLKLLVFSLFISILGVWSTIWGK